MTRIGTFGSPALLIAIWCAVIAPVHPASAHPRQDGGEMYYPVSDIVIRYVHDFSVLTDENVTQRLEDATVDLVQTEQGWTVPEVGMDAPSLAIGEIGSAGETRLSRSAINAIASELTETLSDEFFGARFFAAADDRQIDPATGDDLRRGDRGPLTIRVEYTGNTHQVNEFPISYFFEETIQNQPALGDLQSVQIELVPTDDFGYVAWRPGVAPVSVTLSDLTAEGTVRMTEAGIQQILVAIRDAMTDRGFMAVQVQPAQQDLQNTVDQPGPVRLSVILGVVTEMRTMAAGDRFPVEDRVNHPAHASILARSPVQPDEPESQFLRRDRLDEFIFELSRHPGRRVDVALAPSEEEFGLTLDYLVTENRPLLFYGQLSNTGTRQTGRLRQRFGLLHTQLTGNDDVLNIDYNTAEFDDSHTIQGSYEAPLLDLEGVRWRAYGLYSEFTASDVGIVDLNFEGETWHAGGELIANIHQDRQFFLDLVGGARFMYVDVANFFGPFPVVAGSDDFLIPYAGVRYERMTEQATSVGSLMFEFNEGSMTNLDRDGLNRLGRLFPDKDWVVFKWDLLQTFYLEPLLNPEAWRDVSTPESSTLAHEIALGFRGQYAFGNRLIPQAQQVAGGLYSVRGYPESITAGDTVLIGSVEYRFHLPRIFAPDPNPDHVFGQPFRWAPQQVFGRPDWDLIFRGFFDVAHSINSDRLAFEEDDTLLGAGVGVELQLKRNVNLRVDWGFALEELEGRVNSGSNRLHFVATLLF